MNREARSPSSIEAVRACVLAALVALAPAPVGADEPTPEDSVSLGVEGIASYSADDDPGVLYILPWQPPSIPRRPRAEPEDQAPELLEPIDPVALERHRSFRETLNPSLGSSLSAQ